MTYGAGRLGILSILGMDICCPKRLEREARKRINENCFFMGRV